MCVWEVQVQEEHLPRVAAGQRANQVERDGGPACAALGRVDADHRGLLQQHAPARLDSCVRKRAEALLGQFAQLIEQGAIAAENRGEALAVEGEQRAVGLGVDRRLVRSVQQAGRISEKFTGGQNGDGDQARRLFDDHPAATLLDEEDRVSRLALEQDQLPGGYRHATKAPRQRPQRPLGQGEEHWCALEHRDPGRHVVICRPSALRAALNQRPDAAGSDTRGPGDWRRLAQVVDPESVSHQPFRNPHRASTAATTHGQGRGTAAPTTLGSDVGGHVGSGFESESFP